MELWSRRKFFITSLAGSALAGVNKLFGQARPQPAEGRQPPVRYTDYVVAQRGTSAQGKRPLIISSANGLHDTREEIAPDNENEVYFFSAAFSRTLDGGHTLTNMPASPGGDNHEMWIDPTNGDRMAVVNDGGVSISVNRGHTWDHIQLPIAQIYHVTLDDQIPYFVYGNKQDGPSYRGPSNSLQFSGFRAGGGGGQIPRSVWRPVDGSESGFASPEPAENNIIRSSGIGAGSVGGAMARFDERNRHAREGARWPAQGSGR